MEGQFCSTGEIGGVPRWTLLFAKEPEPDLNVELDEPGAARHQPSPFGSPTPQKPPRMRMLILILFLLIVAGGTYVAMDPDTVMKLIGQKQSVPTRPTPPVTTHRPALSPPSPPPRPTDAEGSTAIAPPGTIPVPAFREHQHVVVVENPDLPAMTPSLSQDAAGTTPGPIVRPAETLLVLDAELHNNRWVYLVRTDEGAKGWIAETQLASKP
jgi:hypothetical protein